MEMNRRKTAGYGKAAGAPGSFDPALPPPPTTSYFAESLLTGKVKQVSG